MNYKINVNWSSKGNAFIADVPELAGCIADGKSFTEALENVKMIIDEYVYTASSTGYQVPQPNKNVVYL